MSVDEVEFDVDYYANPEEAMLAAGEESDVRTMQVREKA